MSNPQSIFFWLDHAAFCSLSLVILAFFIPCISPSWVRGYCWAIASMTHPYRNPDLGCWLTGATGVSVKSDAIASDFFCVGLALLESSVSVCGSDPLCTAHSSRLLVPLGLRECWDSQPPAGLDRAKSRDAMVTAELSCSKEVIWRWCLWDCKVLRCRTGFKRSGSTKVITTFIWVKRLILMVKLPILLYDYFK